MALNNPHFPKKTFH